MRALPPAIISPAGTRSCPPRCLHRSRRVHAASQQQHASEIDYNDSVTDLAFIALCRLAYGKLAGWQSPRSWRDGPETFKGMVDVSRALMKGRSAAQQQQAVIAGFPTVPPWFRRLFPYSRWGAEANAWITPTFFTWLVGPMQQVEVEVPQPDGSGAAVQPGIRASNTSAAGAPSGSIAPTSGICCAHHVSRGPLYASI